MTALSVSPTRSGPISALREKAPLFTALGLFMAFSVMATLTAMQLDPRQFQGESIWIKPIKFQIALSIYALTLAFFVQWVPDHSRNALWFRLYSAVVTFTLFGEILWIVSAAAFGTASHFNTTSPVWVALYALMGVFAVTLTSASMVIGILIWRIRDTGLSPALHLSFSLGLVLTFILTVIVAGYMSSNGSHFVGIPVSGDQGLPILGWSRTAGDLRVAHLFATHALHALPLVGLIASMKLTESRALTVVWIAAFGYTALVLGTFAQALAGLPLI
jgi:hypothetical protein